LRHKEDRGTLSEKRIRFTETNTMTVSVLDNEFMQCWSKLTTAEKEYLLILVKQHVQLKKEDGNDLHMQLVMEESANYFQSEGKPFARDEVKDIAAKKEKRNSL
jgi:hypothetical protein